MRKRFLAAARKAIANPVLQQALDNNATRRLASRAAAFDSLPDPGAFRTEARHIRQETLAHLDQYLSAFRANLEEQGVRVYMAREAEEACRIAVDIARRSGASHVVKSKSMVSEEIGLNLAFERAGIQPVETDLGEFIVQLRGEHPGHIITPAIHLLREQVAETFAEALGMPYSTDVAAMNAAAHAALRPGFLDATVGVSGVNFGVAESGTLCLVTNEGNGRMVTTLPGVHIALMGIERLVPTLGDLAVMLQLLPRSATGQKLTSYISLMHGPGGANGPNERHLILVDNGRSALRRSELQEALLCIRCGACLNACPVFREIGGHAYGSTYPGPIGSLVSPGLFGFERYGHLTKASTLCGACREVCPVEIDFPTLLLRARHRYTREVTQPVLSRLGMRLFAWAATSPSRFKWLQRVAFLATRLLPRRAGWIHAAPFPLAAWTASRDFPPFAARPFRRRPLQAWTSAPASKDAGSPPTKDLKTPEPSPPPADLLARFAQELRSVDGQFLEAPSESAPEALLAWMHENRVHRLLMDPQVETQFPEISWALQQAGIELVRPHLDAGMDQAARKAALEAYDQVEAGLTLAAAGLADTGTIVQPGHANLASLLPRRHFALLPARSLHPSLADWLASLQAKGLRSEPSWTLITGPSRTADIEMTLTIGVHGPAELLVVVLT